MSYYDDGYALGKVHAMGKFNLDPRHTMAYVLREGGNGALEEFMRGFDIGFEEENGKEEEHEAGHP